MFLDDGTTLSRNATEEEASVDAKPMAKNRQHHDYVDVVLVREVVKDEDYSDSIEEKVEYSSFFGFETRLLQCTVKELISRDKEQLPKPHPAALNCSDQEIIPDFQELESEDMLSATRSSGLFSFSSESSGVIAPSLSELSSFELYEFEKLSYCCDELSVEPFEEDYEETNHMQYKRWPFGTLK